MNVTWPALVTGVWALWNQSNRKAGHGIWQSESGYDTALSLVVLGPWTGVTT